MSLIAYTITALELNQSDATASGKQVVIGASCSMYSQPSDLAVTLYDDAARSNGSTAKSTGVNGQVTVYIEAGDYRLATNSVSRYVTVTSLAPVDFATFANLQASSFTQDSQKFTVAERANAAYTLQPAGYVALAGDATLLNGRVAALQIDGWMNIDNFGAVQSVDATTEIQAAFDRADYVYAIGYDYRYTALTASKSLKFIGAGKKKTRLRTTNLADDKILITSNGSHSVIFADMEFGTIGTQTGGSYLKFDSATTQLQSPLITGCNFISPYTAIHLVNSAQFKINGNYFVTYVNSGVIIDNTITPDSGDSSIDGGNVFDAGGDTGDAIVQIASGGLRVVNNKFLNGAYHYRSAFNSSPNTSILVWSANSSEQARVANIAFTATSPTTFSYVNIEGGNQFSVRDGAIGVLVNDTGYNFLSSCNIGGNIFNLASNATGMNIGRLQNSTIGRNTIIGNGTGETGLITGANSSGLKISQQTMISVATEYSLLGGYDITDWEVESGNQTGSTSNAFGSHYITPTIAVTFAKAYPIAPKVQATTVNSNGGLTSLVSNVTTSGFSLNIVGVNSAVTVKSNWTATL